MLVLWFLYLPHLSSMLYVSTLSDQSISQTSLWSRFNLKSSSLLSYMGSEKQHSSAKLTQTLMKLDSDPLPVK